MRYVIMAYGKGRRWGGYLGVPKCLIKIGGETLLQRTARLVANYDANAEIIISSSNEQCEVKGVIRHSPIRDEFEIDRFTFELIQDDICFLYGDTFYTSEAIHRIVSFDVQHGMLFAGSEEKIFAVLANDGELLRRHVEKVRDLYAKGAISDCRGWQLYLSFMGLPFGEHSIAGNYELILDGTGDFNYPSDYERFIGRLNSANN